MPQSWTNQNISCLTPAALQFLLEIYVWVGVLGIELQDLLCGTWQRLALRSIENDASVSGYLWGAHDGLEGVVPQSIEDRVASIYHLLVPNNSFFSIHGYMLVRS